MRWSSREKELKHRAAKKDLVLHKSPIDGTFMIELRTSVSLFPEKIKSKPWGEGSKINPPQAEIFDAATLREVEQFIKQYVPPWSKESDPNVAASINRALGVLADACRNSRKERIGEAARRKSVRKQEKVIKSLGSQGACIYDGPEPGPGKYDIWRGEQIVGAVTDRGGGDVEVQGDDELRAAVKDILSKPATVMTGGFDGKVFWDGGKTYEPGDPRHVRAAIVGGSLVKYGYTGVERVKEEKEKG